MSSFGVNGYQGSNNDYYLSSNRLVHLPACYIQTQSLENKRNDLMVISNLDISNTFWCFHFYFEDEMIIS